MTVRLFFLVTAVVCVCGLGGCKPLPKVPTVLAQNASLDDVIAAVNNNNAKKQRLNTTDARITIDGAAVSLSSNIVYESPKKYRATGEAFLSKQFDIGSNNELFWVWIKQDQRNAIYFGRHEQYESNPVRDTFQIDPGWLIESMGMCVFQPPPHEQHRLVARTAEGSWVIETQRPTALGTYTKYTTVDGKTACVLMQELRNPSGQIVASAISQSHALDTSTGITYPETVDMLFSMQGKKLAMRLSIGRVQFNQASPFTADAFTMPTYPGYDVVDICGQSGNQWSAMNGQ